MPARTKPARKAPSGGSAHQTARVQNRAKLSTTVAAENLAFLESLVGSGRTDSIAGAVDLAISRLRRAENRLRLDRATAAYFEGLSSEAQAEEESLAGKLHTSAGGIDFDREP